jgi:competence protein ComEC
MLSKKNILIFFIFALSFSAGIACHKRQIQKHEIFLNKINNKTYKSIIATVKDIKSLENKRNSVYLELNWESENKNISLYTNNGYDLEVGDKIEIKNATFKKPNNQDFVKYLIKENIATTLFINKLDYDIIEIPKYSVARWLHNKKNNILNSLKAKMSPILFTAFSSIFLGYKNLSKEIENGIKNKFKEWGIMHILARSGLHLIIFLLMCSFLLKFIPVHFFIKQLIILLITIIYALLSWTSTSFLRALCALILYKICPFIGKKTDAVHIVTVICLGILILNPEQIFFLDFQLSFLLTFSLAIISKIEVRKKRKHIEKSTLKPLYNK